MQKYRALRTGPRIGGRKRGGRHRQSSFEKGQEKEKVKETRGFAHQTIRTRENHKKGRLDGKYQKKVHRKMVKFKSH